jgi:putative hydrolase of HD superfamily
MSTKRDLELLFELGTLRYISRVWKQMLGNGFANLAEHHFRVAWTALLLARYENVKNEEKILKMALVHDLPESRTGDVHYVSRLYTKRDEAGAIKDILQGTTFEQDMVELWNEYEERESIEAKIVKDADTLDVDLELREQAAVGNKLEEILHEQRKQVKTMLYTESAKKLWDVIQESSPHDWHVLGKNRLNAGDWKEVLDSM